MTETRSLIDRLIAFTTPKLVTDFAPPPKAIDTRVWVLDRRLRMPAGPILPSRTTILGLPSGGLLVVSPPPVAPGGLDALDALGPVEHVLAPNSYHYLYAREFLARHPRAQFWAAPGLYTRVPNLVEGRELTETAPEGWAGAVEHAILGPTRGVSEVALFHRESATLVLTDSAFHLVGLSSWFRSDSVAPDGSAGRLRSESNRAAAVAPRPSRRRDLPPPHPRLALSSHHRRAR